MNQPENSVKVDYKFEGQLKYEQAQLRKAHTKQTLKAIKQLQYVILTQEKFSFQSEQVTELSEILRHQNEKLLKYVNDFALELNRPVTTIFEGDEKPEAPTLKEAKENLVQHHNMLWSGYKTTIKEHVIQLQKSLNTVNQTMQSFKEKGELSEFSFKDIQDFTRRLIEELEPPLLKLDALAASAKKMPQVTENGAELVKGTTVWTMVVRESQQLPHPSIGFSIN